MLGSLREGLYSVEASLAGFLNVKYYPVRVTFPQNVKLLFHLPFGEVVEGGTQAEAILSGTLDQKGIAQPGVKICLFDAARTIPMGCSVSNDLGQYALTVPPGIYWLELSTAHRRLPRTKIDLSNPGYYRNRVSFSGPE